MQPGGERGPTLEAVDPAESLDEGLLNAIAGILLMAQQIAGNREQPPPVSPDQDRVGSIVTLPKRLDEAAILVRSLVFHARR
jgi:hypothetical protein